MEHIYAFSLKKLKLKRLNKHIFHYYTKTMKYIIFLITCICAKDYNTMYCTNNEGTNATFNAGELNATKSFTCLNCRRCNDKPCKVTYDNASSILYNCICEGDQCGNKCEQHWRNKADCLSCASGVVCAMGSTGQTIICFFILMILSGVLLMVIGFIVLPHARHFVARYFVRIYMTMEQYSVEMGEIQRINPKAPKCEAPKCERRNNLDTSWTMMCFTMTCLAILSAFITFLVLYLVYRSKWIDEITAMKGNGTHICI